MNAQHIPVTFTFIRGFEAMICAMQYASSASDQSFYENDALSAVPGEEDWLEAFNGRAVKPRAASTESIPPARNLS